MKPESLPVFYLAGPTAVGKSAIALALAEQIGGEIVSVDSMQVYRGLDIGTAKATPADRARVRHHLIDVIDLTSGFDASQFVRLAAAAVSDIQTRGRSAIFCGGTGLYFKAWCEGLHETTPGDPQLRAELEATPLPVLLDELAARDRATFETIDRRNPRRVVRAVEVIRLTGKPLSPQRTQRRTGAPEGQAGAARIVVFRRAPDDLRARINVRVDVMFAAGLVEETRRLLTAGLGENRTAMQALGYRQVVEHVRGERGLAETIALVKLKTWQFARRQMTWFRHQTQTRWIDLETSDEAMSRVLHAVRLGAEASPL